jgi:S-adenosylmethionine:tRNA ribosyltransferase-isomerase
MHLSDFDYELPPELIAQTPLKKRDQARLLVIDRAAAKITHDYFRNVGKYLPAGSVLVVNNSKVIPARLLGYKERTGGKVEVFLLRRLEDGYSFETLLRPLKNLRIGDKVRFENSPVVAEFIDFPRRIMRFNRKNILKDLDKIGHMPLPPYIKRSDTPADRKDYQTVYARTPGSVAAPTAGLHFTKTLLEQLKREGHPVKTVTLHVNHATFKLVEEEDITRHKMHFEDYVVTPATHQAIVKAKAQGRKVVAVGTTSCRVLEAVAQNGALKGRTNLFIYPGYQFRAVDALLTNFHLPHSSLLLLAYAFGSIPLMKRAYAEAIKEKYRFFSYGDAMLIL